MFWPIQAGGMNASTTSWSPSASISATARERSMRFSCVRTTPFGTPVVPEVKNIAAVALRGADRGVKARTVVADQREVLAAPEALFRKAAGERSYFFGIVLPGPGLPDAEILLPDSRPRAAHACVVHQQLRERVQRPGVRCHGAPPP